MMSAEVDMVYRDGMTGSHFAEGGMERIIIPHQASSGIPWPSVLKLSTAALRVHNNLIWSSMSVPLTYSVRFNAS